MKKLQVRMRTVTHYATEYDRPDLGSGHLIHCECGTRAMTRDDLAKRHQRSKRVLPGVSEVQS